MNRNEPLGVLSVVSSSILKIHRDLKCLVTVCSGQDFSSCKSMYLIDCIFQG